MDFKSLALRGVLAIISGSLLAWGLHYFILQIGCLVPDALINMQVYYGRGFSCGNFHSFGGMWGAILFILGLFVFSLNFQIKNK